MKVTDDDDSDSSSTNDDEEEDNWVDGPVTPPAKGRARTVARPGAQDMSAAMTRMARSSMGSAVPARPHARVVLYTQSAQPSNLNLPAYTVGSTTERGNGAKLS